MYFIVYVGAICPNRFLPLIVAQANQITSALVSILSSGYASAGPMHVLAGLGLVVGMPELIDMLGA